MADADGGAPEAISSVPQGFSGDHVIAGWPSWLTSVAGEVVNGWLSRRADTFERLDKAINSPFLSKHKLSIPLWYDCSILIRHGSACRSARAPTATCAGSAERQDRGVEAGELRQYNLECIVTSRLSHSLPRRPRCTLRPALPARWPTHPLDLGLAAAHLPKLGPDLAL